MPWGQAVLMISFMQFYPLRVKKKVEETSVSVSLYLEIPDALKETFNHCSGQYITVKQKLGGAEVRRSYSICTPIQSEDFAVTVKKVEGGQMSEFLVNTLQAGQTIECSAPDGRFFIKPVHENRAYYYFFAAGSGITPVYSMIQTLLEHEPKSMVHLLYGNRDTEDIIFRDAIELLEKKYAGQLAVIHCLSKSKSNIFKKIIFGKSPNLQHWKGRIDGKKVGAFLQQFPRGAFPAQYFLCGPGNFINQVERALIENHGASPKQIHKEYFTTSGDGSSKKADHSNTMTKLTVHLNGKVTHLSLDKSEKILDRLIEAKLDPPYSCSSGACSTCMAKVVKGNVSMDVSTALDEEEIAAGYILTCQSRALSDEVEIAF